MEAKIVEKCIYCGGEVIYDSSQELVRCEWCGQTLMVARFESEIASRKKTEEENVLIRQKLAQTEKEKQAADDRLFSALSGLSSLDQAQGETLELLKILKSESSDHTNVLGNMLRTLLSGQKDADSQLQLLQTVSDRILGAQNDALAKIQAQSEIISQLYSMEMDAGKRQQLANNFMIWMQNIQEEDAAKLRQIGKASRTLLQEQRQIGDNVEKLRQEAADIQQSIKSFEGKWESSRLQEIQQLYHQAWNFQSERRFDKADEYYRRVLVKGGEDPDVYWRLLMCHYCLTYQRNEDGKAVPIILNPDLTDPEEIAARRELRLHLGEKEKPYYEEELRKIDRILDSYREVRHDWKFDVFISVKQEKDGYYTPDRNVGLNLHKFLEEKGYKVFNSEVTKLPVGDLYEPYIISALLSSKVMIVVGTCRENMESQWVKNEWSRFQWLQYHEKKLTGKTDRKLLCYLAQSMQPRDIPKDLDPNRQAITDGVNAHDELLESLSFLNKAESANAFYNRSRSSAESVKAPYHQIENQMTTWLYLGKYDKVMEKYEELTDKGWYLTHSFIHLAALCANKQVSEIQKIVYSELILDQQPLYKLAVRLCLEEEEKTRLRELLEQNKEWRNRSKKEKPETAKNGKAESIRQETTTKSDSQANLAEELYNKGMDYFFGRGVLRDENEAVRSFQSAAALGHTGALNWLKEIKKNKTKAEQEKDEKEREEKQQKEFEEQREKWYQQALLCQKEGKMEEAFSLFRHAADAGNASAQNWVGVCYGNGRGVAVNKTEAVRWYQKAAENGDTWGQYNYALYLENGTGTAKNPAEAVKWYRKAAEQGHVWGQHNYAWCLVNGEGIAKNEAEAVKWFRKAADAGNASAQNWLGVCYGDGRGVAVNKTEAVRWYQKAAENGDMYGQYNYALYLENGTGTAKNPAEAVKWYRKAAEEGHAKSQNELGRCYENGIGISKNMTEAVRWYKKAAEQGNAWGQHNYAWCLINGEGIAKNEAEAVKWFRKAAEAGNASAQNWVGVCYGDGRGVPANKTEAVRWYQKAAENGDTWGQHNYAYRLLKGEGIAKNEAEAVKWFRKAAEAGNASAQNWLGVCYGQGNGVPVDKAEAFRWYQKAAENGDTWGQHNYGNYLHNGIGTAQNQAEGVKWYRKAAEAGLALSQYRLGECYEKGRGVPANKEEAKLWYQKAADQGNEDAKKSLEKLTKKKWF